MPFKSAAQERYMWKFHPDIARRWVNEYGSLLAKKAKKRKKKNG